MKDVKDRDGQFQDIFLNMTKKRAENLSVFGVFLPLQRIAMMLPISKVERV